MQRRSLIAGLAAIGWLRATPAFAQTGSSAVVERRSRQSRRSSTSSPKVTDAGSRDFVPVAERIAAFDNDGTLWTEQPDLLPGRSLPWTASRRWRAQHPGMEGRSSPSSAVLDGRPRWRLAAMGEKGMLEIMAATHAAMTTEEFRQAVLEWLATARHPRFKRPYTDLVYQPMLGAARLTCAPTGSRPSSSRAAASSSCGLDRASLRHPARAGGRLVGRHQVRAAADGKPVLSEGCPRSSSSTTVRASRSASTGSSAGGRSWPSATPTATSRCWNGPPQAPVRASWAWSTTDAAREYAYDRKFPIGRLDKAWDEAVRRGVDVVDMKNDWKVIYPFDLEVMQRGRPHRTSGACNDRLRIGGWWRHSNNPRSVFPFEIVSSSTVVWHRRRSDLRSRPLIGRKANDQGQTSPHRRPRPPCSPVFPGGVGPARRPDQ